MSEGKRIDARGKKCPRPIIELAKARRGCSVGETIIIIADDLAFESDVTAWCETTGNTLVELATSGNEVTAVIHIDSQP